MPEIEEILNKVEELREKLNKLAQNKNEKLTDPKIIAVSRELDVLLNTYHKLMTNKMIKFRSK
ncbi:aspartyl-phosphate phosphatase Spo0E family protein [Pelosinus fermentans]|uniref:Sporulation stage 0, Spo0E-like regulatory phosphatase n=1 Tax=Pelosinus fermentans JBW45 TaxID=1192197 RepID=I8TZ08_9FIRM|nr:aspartyl-phosphate phosphatase Spo0E family protein [Pelosinus fermentans]AJQ27274.1 Sporulation stage 0, Spo0E-like regulatory phosphatase [Pelosinus fermentans JBW45]